MRMKFFWGGWRDDLKHPLPDMGWRLLADDGGEADWLTAYARSDEAERLGLLERFPYHAQALAEAMDRARDETLPPRSSDRSVSEDAKLSGEGVPNDR